MNILNFRTSHRASIGRIVALFVVCLAAACSETEPAPEVKRLLSVSYDALCEPCTSDADCPSEFRCLADVGVGHCAPRCNPEQDICPFGWSCVGEGPAGVCESANGSCPRTCREGRVDCNLDADDGCETVLGANDNCSACGHQCANEFANATAECQAASCVLTACNPGWGDCDGLSSNGCEADLSAVDNCGVCGNTCGQPTAQGQVACVEGMCQIYTCNDGWADCNGLAADGCEERLGTNAHCTDCNQGCGDGDLCIEGTCRNNPCDPEQADCNGDLECDTELGTLANCGTCGDACFGLFPNAAVRCEAGVCKRGDCNPGFDDCNGDPSDGCEAQLTANPKHCGACGAACGNNTQCVTGNCKCDSGWADCNGDLGALGGDGCEQSLNAVTSCGSCTTSCSAETLPMVQASGCINLTCGGLVCVPGHGNCNGIAQDGCEQRLNTNSHCGQCGTKCLGNTVCTEGTCVPINTNCPAGLGDCNNDGVCETNTTNDVGNCGKCNSSCGDIPFVNARCEAGQCVFDAGDCVAGYGDCDGSAETGCETPLGTEANCGECGAACAGAYPNAQATCVTGVCALLPGSCANGYGDCNGVASDGCETPLLANDSNCGSCFTDCGESSAEEVLHCQGGQCLPTGACAPGFLDCDSPADGQCEAESTALTSCGWCGNNCSVLVANASIPTCTGGVCGYLWTVDNAGCSEGFGDCDGNASNGCESSYLSVSHCGGCGLDCAKTVFNVFQPLCTATGCSYNSSSGFNAGCKSGWKDCGNVWDGCETPEDEPCPGEPEPGAGVP